MKVYRAGNTESEWTPTDAKRLSAYLNDWQPGKVLNCDGTKDKSGSKRSDFGVEFELQDFLDLSAFLPLLFSKQQEEKKKLRDAVDSIQGLAMRGGNGALEKIETIIDEIY